jgi:hypothetical protein
MYTSKMKFLVPGLVAISAIMLMVGVGLKRPVQVLSPSGSRAAPYENVSDLNRDAALVAKVEPIDGTVQTATFPTVTLPFAGFRVVKASDPTFDSQTIQIVLPSGQLMADKFRRNQSLVWLVPLTFGKGINENMWVVVGDGAGLFQKTGTSKSKDEDDSTGYDKQDEVSSKLQRTTSFSDAKPERRERPNR